MVPDILYGIGGCQREVLRRRLKSKPATILGIKPQSCNVNEGGCFTLLEQPRFGATNVHYTIKVDSMASAAVTRELPPEVLEQLRILDLELEEGDITQKGYEKKKSNLLQALGLSDSTQNDHEPPAENGTINVPKEDDSIRNHDTLPTDMEPEPSAADVVDFLDYLPSPTHSPKQPEHGAALMEENHQRLQAAASSSATAEPVSLQQQPPSPAFQHQGLSTPVGPRPLGPSSSLYMATSTMTSPRPSWAYDPRMARPAYQQATYPPATARPPYSAYPVQPRPPMGLPPYNRPPPPPPTNMPPYGSRPMYPPQQRPMYPHQQLSGAPRPGYPPATGMMPARPMPPFGSPRPMNNTAPFTPPTVPHIIHNRTSSLESGSEANTMIQNQSVGISPLSTVLNRKSLTDICFRWTHSHKCLVMRMIGVRVSHCITF